MSWSLYPRQRVLSCSLCEMGVITAQRKDNIPGLFIFRCTCSQLTSGRTQYYPLWSKKFAENFKPIKGKKMG